MTFYIGYSETGLLGFAAIESNVVRTHNQTFMVVLGSDGRLLQTIILAFHEPPEYIASPRWLKQFEGVDRPEQAKVVDKIAGIVGASLTSESIASGIRRFLSAYKVLKVSNAVQN